MRYHEWMDSWFVVIWYVSKHGDHSVQCAFVNNPLGGGSVVALPPPRLILGTLFPTTGYVLFAVSRCRGLMTKPAVGKLRLLFGCLVISFATSV